MQNEMLIEEGFINKENKTSKCWNGIILSYLLSVSISAVTILILLNKLQAAAVDYNYSFAQCY